MVKKTTKLLRKLLKGKPIAKTWVCRPEVLLCPNVPKPMHGVAPRVILGAKWWNETRKAAYKSTAYHCIACGVHKSDARGRQWLEGHELYSVNYTLGRLVYLETVPLCHFCHNYIHDGRLTSLLEKGLMHHSKFAEIIKHGDRVLAKAGLNKLSYQEREERMATMLVNRQIAAWGNWRMLIFGKLYKPKFKTPEEWAAAMAKDD